MKTLLKTIRMKAEVRNGMNPPKHELLLLLAVMSLLLYLITVFSYSILFVATIPLLVYWIYGFVWYCRMWKQFSYALIYPMIAVIVVFLIGAVTANAVRGWLYSVIQWIL